MLRILPGEGTWVTLTRSYPEGITFTITTEKDSQAWVIVGSDSAFEARSTFVYQNIMVSTLGKSSGKFSLQIDAEVSRCLTQLTLKLMDEEHDHDSDEIDTSSDAPAPTPEEAPAMAPEPTPPADDSAATFTSVAGISLAALALVLN